MRLNTAGVVIPSYNRHEYLSAAIDSVLIQRNAAFKLVIVNDYCGTDSGKKMEELELLVKERDDSRIHVLHNQSTLWISRTRNRAIKMLLDMDVPYIFFLDHDDVWSSDEKLRDQMQLLSSGDIWLVWTQFDIIDRVWSIIWESRNPSDHESMIELMLMSCPILMSSLWVNSRIFRENGLLDESLNGCDDWELLMRNLSQYRWVNIPERMTQYRIFWENTSKTQWHRLVREQLDIIRKTGKNYPHYYRSLMLWYARLVIPQWCKEILRPLKKRLFPKSTNIVLSN